MKPVGIVGTGVMGRAVAGRLIESGRSVAGYDAASHGADLARAMGVSVCASLAQLAESVGCAILFLPGPQEIATAMAKGSVIVDMSTSSPANTEAMAAAAERRGIRYLDAPVLGRPASVGKWSLPVGGDAAALEEVRPLLERVATSITHVGPSGSGHKVKLLNNMMFGAINAMTAEMMAVAERVGIEPAKLYEVITASQAATVSNLFREVGRRVCEDRYDDPTFTVALLSKDVRLGLEMAEAAGAPVVLGRAIDFLNKTACAQGMGADDTAVMWRCVKNLWKS
jgi:3-hydroxyisobutyrate dehydrogenase/2-hydroxy-3-oxopropionate reductase